MPVFIHFQLSLDTLSLVFYFLSNSYALLSHSLVFKLLFLKGTLVFFIKMLIQRFFDGLVPKF